MRSDKGPFRGNSAPPVCAACFCVALFALGVGALAAQVPVHQEQLHRVVFEDALLRILDVSYGGGETSLDHVHGNGIAIVCISGGELRTRSAINGVM